ncbi:efflux RND transporter periplasmic adaptor subunit [Sphingomonas sp. IC-56]|uniref:efflux RND transporter periplasmic adaptor subunit n=1 Tax=Sphingomonas sp. IC-56 TaxID=2898529 RepID=UPI001E2E4DC1|nr:efflux RND transporter periplasmic adaptor subunit [Sphingomonas sp. IC-56]MCD2324641.1 efflux RND transporter periplasmic adaptor subunit [Sphingomonas sp. IC-56]
MTSRRRSTVLLLAASLLASCGGTQDPAQKKGGGRGPSGPAQVGYVVVQPTSVPVTTELAGRVTAFQMSEVRPQVAGILQKRFFTEGSIVKAGQTLYQIDPSIYQAQAAQAQANLQSAQANANAARIRAQRYRPLAEMEAVSQQEYTDVAAQAQQANAAVAQNNAAVQTARINLRFTKVPAPITGRIGRSLVTEGALVTTNQADPLAVIQRLDPIFVDIQQSSAAMLALRKAMAKGGTIPGSASVRLVLEDGSDFGRTGTVQFSEVVVNQNTGTVTLRARFDNPEGLLLPGMFVRAQFAQAIDTEAFLVPQAGVSRDPKGAATVYIVGPGNRAVARTVVAERTQGAYWVVTQGLAPGDKVIVQGTANLRPDAEIRPVPASAPQKIQAPKGGGQAATQGGGGPRGSGGGAAGGNAGQSKSN